MLNGKSSTFSFISINPREKLSPFNRMLHCVAVCYCAGSVCLPELVCWKTAASASGNYADEHQESEPK